MATYIDLCYHTSSNLSRGVSGYEMSGVTGRKFNFLFLLPVAVAVIGLWRLRFGLDLTDEGIYLTSPLRYILGDLPFRDEIHNVVRCFDILLWPVMKLLPGDGGVLAFRYLGFALHIFGVVFLYSSVKKHVDAAVLNVACAVVIMSNVFHLWTPGYSSMAVAFVFVSIGGFIRGAEAKKVSGRRLWGIFGGTAFFLAAFCYLPLFAVVPAFVIFLPVMFRSERWKSGAVAAAWFFATATVLMVCAAAVVHLSGLTPYFIRDCRDVLSNSLYANGMESRHLSLSIWLLKIFVRSLPQVVFIGLAFLPAIVKRPIPAGKVGAAVFTAAVAAAYCFYLSRRDFAAMCEELCAVSVMAAVAGLACAEKKDGRNLHALAFVIALACWLIAGFVSTTGWTSASNILPALLLFGVLFGYRAVMKDKAEGAFAAKAAFVCILAAVGVCLIAGNVKSSYRDGDLTRLDTRFTYGKLDGVYSTKTRVKMVEDLLKYMSPRLKRGDRLLAYEKIPMIHYLTGTTPALETMWVVRQWPVSLRERMIRDMVKHGRTPEYAIRIKRPAEFIGMKAGSKPYFYSDDPAKDPINAFVCRNYTKVRTIGEFEVWRLKNAEK